MLEIDKSSINTFCFPEKDKNDDLNKSVISTFSNIFPLSLTSIKLLYLKRAIVLVFVSSKPDLSI